MIASKAARGWDLYLSRHRRIQRLGEDTYSVSSSASGGKDSYSRYPCLSLLCSSPCGNKCPIH